jgi:putative NADH-flavin reductase
MIRQSISRGVVMKIAIIGVTGRVGSRIAAEARARGHAVTGIVRTGDATAPTGVALVQGDATDPVALAGLIAGHDAVVSAANFRILKAAPLVEALRKAGVKRLLVVGGAASLEIAPGQILLDAPGFPDAYKTEAVPGKAFLDDLQGVGDLDWSFLSPAIEFVPGERTGTFRLGGDQLMRDAAGRSWISMEDYAIAVIDELEVPKHLRERFSIAY